MCDTIVALPSVTKDKRIIFGKNSDRSPNEPHLVVKYKAKDYNLEIKSKVMLTYISIPQVEHTFEVVLMKPSWMWGAEMGFNEYGLNIGNEAVFTKEKYRKSNGILGMDILRLTLERKKNALSAVHYIISLLDQYEQGGNCGYDKNFYYHNSFLIADKKEAYVMETAGKYYVVKKIKDFYAISNCLSIETDFDMIHPNAINDAIRNHRCKLGEKFNFAKTFEEPIFTYFSKSKQRRKMASDILESEKGNITVDTFKKILRSHNEKYEENSNSVGSICMHAGGIIGDQTTGSYIASLSLKDDFYYITGTSLPCLSIYKPYKMEQDNILPLGNEERAKEYWLKNERLNRLILSGQINKEEFINDVTVLENRYKDIFELEEKDSEIKIEQFWEESNILVEKYLNICKDKKIVFSKGRSKYKKYWRKKTNILFENHR